MKNHECITDCNHGLQSTGAVMVTFLGSRKLPDSSKLLLHISRYVTACDVYYQAIPCVTTSSDKC